MLFGHRTNAGGPYRYQHLLHGGDVMTLVTTDGRRYTYQMAGGVRHRERPERDPLDRERTRRRTVSLVSCTQLNRLPTNTAFRLISIFALVDWVDLG